MNERPESKRSCIICEKATVSPRLKRLFTLRLRRGNWKEFGRNLRNLLPEEWMGKLLS